ncbi:MAG: hypothetical protein WD529_02250 [Balneolaceae bacterium]
MNAPRRTIHRVLFVAILFLAWGPVNNASAQVADTDEVFLHFRHAGVINSYISSFYTGEEFYIPVTEVFSLLQIDYEVRNGRLQITGEYLDRGRYRIDFNSRTATLGDVRIEFEANDFLIEQLDYYLHPDLFEELFGLRFIPDFNTLGLILESDDTMPVVARRNRELRREQLTRRQQQIYMEYYPLRFDRQQNQFNTGFLDYSLSANISQTNSSYLFSGSIGSEVMGGDLQGSLFGNFSQSASTLRSSNLRWRYGIRDNEWVSRITAGQSTSDGLLPAAYTGIQITNDPIEPRYIYDDYLFTGTAAPSSEIEIYRNNTLIDYQMTSEDGYYQFRVPLTYGISQYTVRTYGASGQMSERQARLQIPFNFLPPGEVNYSLNAGRMDTPLPGTSLRSWMGHGTVTTGFTNWLTGRANVEYFSAYHDELPTISTALSARLMTNYLVTVEAAPARFYRLNSSVIYPSSASFQLDYTHFSELGGIYNTGRSRSRIQSAIFTPIPLSDSFPLFLRLTLTHDNRVSVNTTRYRIELNSRLGRMNVRMSYRDTQTGAFGISPTTSSRIQGSGSYSFSRSREVHPVLRGLYLRGQMTYAPARNSLEDLEIHAGRSLFDRGRFQAALGRNFIGGFTYLRFGLTFDFSSVRSNSNLRSTAGNTVFTQSLRGSLGYDSNNGQFLTSNRQQVGRSALAIRMYVDNNNNGTYDDGDELQPGNAVRIERGGGVISQKDGVTYITQLQPYRQYNLSVNKGALLNPMHVPQFDQFSLVTDPNQYKQIDVPLYMSGVVDGRIFIYMEEGRNPLPGVRLFLNQTDAGDGAEPYSEELRTYSDGSFYAYEIPPGEYELAIDPAQLTFLNARSNPDRLQFKVRALPEGDFVEGLEISVVPETQSEPASQ